MKYTAHTNAEDRIHHFLSRETLIKDNLRCLLNLTTHQPISLATMTHFPNYRAEHSTGSRAVRYIASKNIEPFLRDFNGEGLLFSPALQFTCHCTEISVSQTGHVTKERSAQTHRLCSDLQVRSNINRLLTIQEMLF